MMIKKLINWTKRIVRRFFNVFGYEVRKLHPDFYLHQYDNYEQYRDVQIFHNKRKLGKVWADEGTLNLVADRVMKEFGSQTRLFALCHGVRNGFEQNYLATRLAADIIGTDISDTATQFPNSVHWDYHDVNNEWVGRCHFIYTNSLDQSWKPELAVATWLDQLQVGGLLIIEHTHGHGAEWASEMDPFGAKPEYMPYLLCEWFGHRISIEIIKGVKSNMKMDVWLFVLKRLY